VRRPLRLVLVALAGNTPAVVTETLWCLEQQRGLRVDEIRVVTTASGKEAVARNLWGPEGHFTRYCRDYHVPPGRIAFGPPQVHVLQDHQGRDLHDIRDDRDNTAAADHIFSLIQDWTGRSDEVLHGSVAGGRKTMGLYLAMAFMLCGRPQDALSHVLVDPRFEAGVRDFYYPPPQPRPFRCCVPKDHPNRISEEVSSDEARLELADIPFLRLREVVGAQIPMGQGYLEALRRSQAICRYLNAPPELEVCLRCGQVQFGDFSFRLSKQMLAVYVLFLTEFNSPGAKASLTDLFTRRERLAALERQIDELRLGAREAYAWETLRSPEDLQEKLSPIISKINRTVQTAMGANEVSRRLTLRRQPYGVDIPRFTIMTDRCPRC
jgi:CRISPR-associated protein (TIGR02584 family)